MASESDVWNGGLSFWEFAFAVWGGIPSERRRAAANRALGVQ
jgi:hypothetical protein